MSFITRLQLAPQKIFMKKMKNVVRRCGNWLKLGNGAVLLKMTLPHNKTLSFLPFGTGRKSTIRFTSSSRVVRL